jgi:hypothetical protein
MIPFRTGFLMINKSLALLLIPLLIHLPSTAAETGNMERRQRAHAMELFLKGRYFQCVTETEKMIFYWKDKGSDSQYLISSSYFLGGQYRSVCGRLAENSAALSEGRNRLLLSQSFMKLGDWRHGAEIAAALSYEGDSALERYDVLMRRIEPLFYLNDYAAAMAAVDEYAGMYDEAGTLAALRSDLRLSRDIPRRSRTVSTALSALAPGLGQIWCGRYLEGLLSLLGVSLTAAGGAWLCAHDQRGAAGAAFFFSGLFYAGNLYGAYNSASDFNERYNRIYRDDMVRKYIPAYDPAKYLNAGAEAR